MKYTWPAFLSVLLLTALIWAEPLSGGARAPSVILMLMGIVLIAKKFFLLTDLRWQRMLVILALFWLPTAISLFGSYAPDKTLDLLVLLPLFLLFSASVLYIFDHYLSQNTLQIIITAICVFWLADATIQFFFDKDIFGVERYEGNRIVGPFAEHLRLGLFISILLPVVLAYLERHGWGWQVLYLLVATTIVLLTGVRTDLLTVILAVGLYIISNRKYRLLLAVLPVIVFAGILAGSNSDISESKLKSFSNVPSNYEQWNKLSSYRLDIWSTGWNMLKLNPVTGVGGRSFSSAYNDYSSEGNIFHDEASSAYHAHHPVISIAAETGGLGLLGLCAIIILLWRWGRHSTNVRGLSNPWAQILLLMIFPIQSMPILFTLWWFPVVTFILACYLHSIHTHVNYQHTDNRL